MRSLGSKAGGPAAALSTALLTLLAVVHAVMLTARAGEAAAAEAGAIVYGKTTFSGEGAGDSRVFAYRSFEDLLSHDPAATSAPSEDDGFFRLELAPGSYYLVAKRGVEEGDGPLPVGGFFSYHGTNPFALVPGVELEANFPLVRKATEPVTAEVDDPSSGAIEGVVTHDGGPLEGVRVRLYLDAESAFRGAAYAVSSPTGSDGEFRFDYLPESGYYLVAHRREGGGGAGPLETGDYYGYFVDNPVRVAAGGLVQVSLEVVNKAREASRDVDRPHPRGTRISGTIADPEGNAVGGVYAFAYEEKVMAHRKPAFISAEAGEDGRYIIHFSRGGTFYVGARSSYGDSPAKGEWYGRYDGTADHSVKLEPGETLDGIDIVVERILP